MRRSTRHAALGMAGLLGACLAASALGEDAAGAGRPAAGPKTPATTSATPATSATGGGSARQATGSGSSGATPAASAGSAGGFYSRGSLQLRYVGRSADGRSGNERDRDHDLYGDLAGEVGYGEHVRALVSARLDQDLDGRGSTVFDSIDDTWSEPFHGYLYEALVEARDLGPLGAARVGRQWKGDGIDIRFDGALLQSARLADLVRVEAYGGKPARLYESTARGDWLAGGAIELTPLPRLEVRLDYVHVTDRRRSVGVRPGPAPREYRDDDLVQLVARYRVSETLRLFARASTFAGRSSRFEAEAYYFDPAPDLLLRGRYIAQLGSYRDLSIEFSPLDEVLDRYEPYHEVLGEVRKGIADTLWVGAGAAARILGNGADEGPFNHEFVRLFGSVEAVDVPWAGLRAYLLLEHYQSDEGPDRTLAASGDLTQEIRDGLAVSVGTSYELYKLDEFHLDERDDVQSVYARVEWEPAKGLRLRAGYTFEVDDEDVYHTLRIAVRYAW